MHSLTLTQSFQANGPSANWQHAETPSFKYAQRLNQWKDAHVLGQTNTSERGYNSVLFVIQSRAERSLCWVM